MILGLFKSIVFNVFNNSVSRLVHSWGKSGVKSFQPVEVLLPAGIASLKNHKEIRMAFESLMKNPFRTWKDSVEKVGYKRFFYCVAASGRELNKETIEEFLGHFESPSKRAL